MPDPVIYTGALPIGEHTAVRLVQLLADEQRERRTRRGRRVLGPWHQAVLVLRWFLDGTRVAQLAVDNRISLSTAYRYLHEGIDVLAAAAPGLHGALLAARLAGHTHLGLDGTLIRTDRSKAAGPSTTARGRAVDLWWSGKHHHHGGNVQVVTAPDGWPLWTSPVRPGREHDTTCARTHHELLPALDAWSDEHRVVLADLGYEGENGRLVCPIKKPAKPAGAVLDADQRTVNMLHSATRALAERGNALLKTTFKALRRVSLCPWRIGAITAAALVLLHTEHNRTT
ncbi:MAG: transposase family protein [Pseudonocardiaceae bacterium]|nr:MAG: transposase family protein [Pseudonocardiaceae bacterium]